MYTENLGRYAEDMVTEYKGVITQVSLHFTGCVQYGIRGKVIDNVIPPVKWFDTYRIKIGDICLEQLQKHEINEKL